MKEKTKLFVISLKKYLTEIKKLKGLPPPSYLAVEPLQKSFRYLHSPLPL